MTSVITGGVAMIKKFCVAIALVIMVFSGALSACSRPLSTQAIIVRTADARDQVSSVKMDGRLDFDVSGTSAVSLSADMSGSIDSAAKRMQMLVAMSMNAPSLPEFGVATSNLNFSVYIVDGWVYVSLGGILGMDKTWMKSPVEEGAWESQDSAGAMTGLLVGAIEVTQLDMEPVDGVDCYVLQLDVDFDKLLEAGLSPLSGAGLDLDNLGVESEELGRLFQNIELKEWVGSKDFLLRKAEMSFSLDPSELGIPGVPAGSVSLNLSYHFYDYNVPVDIVLPQEALAAEELP
jgi:hypothetical protein